MMGTYKLRYSAMNVTVLLHFALALLIAAQQPNVPDSLRTTAIDTANRAILVAMEDSKPKVVAPEEASYEAQGEWDTPLMTPGKDRE